MKIPRWIIVMGCGVLLAGRLFAQDRLPETAPPRLVGEWELQGPLVWVWPDRLPGSRNVMPLVVHTVRALPEDIDIALAGVRPPDMEALQRMGRPIRYVPLEELGGMRIRQWAGVAAADGEGRLFMAGFRYQPGQLSGREASRAEEDQRAGRQLGETMYGRVLDVPLRVSGGGVTHNGAGIAILSNRLIRENETWSLRSIHELWRQWLGVTQLVILPVQPGDLSGGVRQVARFVSPTQLLVLEPKGDEGSELQRYVQEVNRILREDLDEAVEMITVPQVEHEGRLGLQKNYLHFLQAGRYLWLPSFGTAQDEEVRAHVQAALPEVQVVLFPEELTGSWNNMGHALDQLAVPY